MSAEMTAAAARERAEAFREILGERILVLDGATGTWLLLTPVEAVATVGAQALG